MMKVYLHRKQLKGSVYKYMLEITGRRWGEIEKGGEGSVGIYDIKIIIS